MITKVTIYGERCSGNNYLEQLLITNFNVEIVWTFGRKHFFGFNDLSNSNDVLFIGIVRNLVDWVNSFYRNPHHLPTHLLENINNFLNDEYYSVYNNGTEFINDRNIENKKRYKNIFELRHIKNKFLVETMPTLVKNYILITYDNLVNNFVNVMNQIKNCNLEVKKIKVLNKKIYRYPIHAAFKIKYINFPINITYYKKLKSIKYEKKENTISKDLIMSKANLFYEKILFPDYDFQYKNIEI